MTRQHNPLSGHSPPETTYLETERQQSVVTIQTTLDPPRNTANSTTHHTLRNANIRQLERLYSRILKHTFPQHLLTERPITNRKNRKTATGCNDIAPEYPE